MISTSDASRCLVIGMQNSSSNCGVDCVLRTGGVRHRNAGDETMGAHIRITVAYGMRRSGSERIEGVLWV